MREDTFDGKTGRVRVKHGQRFDAEYDVIRIQEVSNGSREWIKVGYAIELQVKLLKDFRTENTSLPGSKGTIKSVTGIEEAPLTFVGEKTEQECVLSHSCVKFVDDLGDLSSNGTRKKPQRHCCTGFMIEVLLWLERDLDVQFELYMVEDRKYGAYDHKTKKWNGMIQDLIEEKAEIALAPLNINSARAKVVGFSSTPFVYDEVRIIISSQSLESSPLSFGFLAPFDLLLWIMFLVGANVVLVFVWLLERLSPYGHYHKDNGTQENAFNLSVCMSYIWSSVAKLQLDDVMPRSSSARFTAAVFSFVTLVLTTSYTANLTASILSLDVHHPITGIRDPKVTQISVINVRKYVITGNLIPFRDMVFIPLNRHLITPFQPKLQFWLMWLKVYQ